MVLLSTQNIKFRRKKTYKSMPKYIGSFKISGKFGSVAYKVQLPDKNPLYATFHVALLRRYQTEPRRASVNQPDDKIEGENYFKVERVLDHQDHTKPRSITNHQTVLSHQMGRLLSQRRLLGTRRQPQGM
jgi:hypothetical protein